MSVDDVTGEVTDLLQHLIRNACVNDGTPSSGEEVRSAALLEGYLEGAGLDVERYEATPGRDNLVARIEGSDPDRLREIVEWGARHCPVDDAARRAVPISLEIETGS